MLKEKEGGERHPPRAWRGSHSSLRKPGVPPSNDFLTDGLRAGATVSLGDDAFCFRDPRIRDKPPHPPWWCLRMNLLVELSALRVGFQSREHFQGLPKPHIHSLPHHSFTTHSFHFLIVHVLVTSEFITFKFSFSSVYSHLPISELLVLRASQASSYFCLLEAMAWQLPLLRPGTAPSTTEAGLWLLPA